MGGDEADDCCQEELNEADIWQTAVVGVNRVGGG